MKIGDKVKCATSTFLCPYYGDIGTITEVRDHEVFCVAFPQFNIKIWMRDYEIEVIE